jgi:GAF domain-containing protein
VNRETITRELLEEVVLGFGATSGAVYLDGEDPAQPVHATRSWDGVAKLTIPLRSTDEGAALGVLALGPQRRGGEYSGRQREMLQEMAQFVAAAIEQDRQRVPLQTRVTETTDYSSGEKFVYVSDTGSGG